MNILITGGTGFVGQHLTNILVKEKHHVYILTRSPEAHTSTDSVTYLGYQEDVTAFSVIHAVVNLAGDSLFGYWTKEKKRAIQTSRIETTKRLIALLEQMEKKPAVLINGSAIGYYGMSEDLIFTEETTTPGNDFLANVVREWEQTASQAKELGIRTVFTRFGVILGKQGALPYMSLPVKMFVGGRIGNGEQWVSWIHIEDAVHLIQFCIMNDHIEGAINVTAPNPKRNKEFTRILAEILHRPYWLPTPASFIQAGLGQMSQLIANGQYVLPNKAETNQYPFRYPWLEEALKQILDTKHK
ncbi:TIGR01777 family oxidoreductase [Lentibacillus sp. N15]|uniref:TIGR01777 family oxidoreductase n=1 Tax=Lentibacillus songyuanensis TaxID=3136161 RepID=UPI0031BA8BD8